MIKTIPLKLIFISVAISVIFWGCSPSFEKQFPEVYQQYQSLLPHKALAIAVKKGGRYVYGFSGGKDSIKEAKEDALFECQSLQEVYKVEKPCEIYFINDEKVNE